MLENDKLIVKRKPRNQKKFIERKCFLHRSNWRKIFFI